MKTSSKPNGHRKSIAPVLVGKYGYNFYYDKEGHIKRQQEFSKTQTEKDALKRVKRNHNRHAREVGMDYKRFSSKHIIKSNKLT